MSTSTASRPSSSRINVHEPGEYPIVLGDSLRKDAAATQAKFLRLRYNWEPSNGFSNQKGSLKHSNGLARLAYTDNTSGSSTYEYAATTTKDIDSDDTEQTSNLALIYDSTKASFVLEQISHSFDFNLASAHNQSRDEIKSRRRINVDSSEEPANGTDVSMDNGDDDADAANPFDFRHFLSEAKENAEKATQTAGGRTPVPGSRTPLSGISSPSLVAGRFLSNSTPQFRPTPTSAPIPKKSSLAKPVASAPAKKQSNTKRKPAAKPSAPQPKSSELVLDSSDEDDQDTITVSRPSTSQTQERNHTRNVSSISLARSPARSTVRSPAVSPTRNSVDDGGLEIVMGSPQHEQSHRRVLLDLEAFRSQTHTPSLPPGNNRAQPQLSDRDIEMRDRSEDEDEEEQNNDEDADGLGDIDDDVEELALDSPMSRKGDERRQEIEKIPSPPTPMAPPMAEEEEDPLAAELARELYGSDESEVSEEE